ncbi:MAG: hypothetical protein OCC49_12760 [Fibrobacterales bacterium]
MKGLQIKAIIGIMILGTTVSSANDKNGAGSVNLEPAMELGGVVTIDFGGPTDALKDAPVEVGTVELSANVPVSNDILASITLVGEEGLTSVAIDAAVVEWKLSQVPLTLLMGQNDIGHGLNSTRLISDPLMKGLDFGLNGPSISAVYSAGMFSPFVGGVYLATPGEMSYVVEGTSVQKVESEASGVYRGLVGIEASPSEMMMVRASGSLGKKYQDAVVGSEISIAGLTIDLEGYYQFTDGDQMSGWYTGVAYQVSDMFALATRYDMSTKNSYDAYGSRIGVGGSFSFAHGLFAALEYGRTLPSEGDGENTIGIQIGLESSLELPGFQRKTLKQQ